MKFKQSAPPYLLLLLGITIGIPTMDYLLVKYEQQLAIEIKVEEKQYPYVDLKTVEKEEESSN